MGCATGTLAVPLARAGHRVHGCDFAEAMLAILDKRAAAENLPITSHLMAWEDDWEASGLGEDSVDVAFASRSLMAEAVAPFVAKLDSAARSRAAVVVPASLPPSSDPRLLTYLGRAAKHPHNARKVLRALRAMGRIPTCATTTTFRPHAFLLLRRGLLRPAPSRSPRAVHGPRAETLRRLRGPTLRARGHYRRLGREQGAMDPRLHVARHLGVYRLAHRREPMGLTRPGLVLLNPPS